MLEEVLEGLQKKQKYLPSKYFYDEKGSELFDQITELDEYYPTRTERAILIEHVEEIGKFLGKKVELIEPGSGSSEKTRILLEGMDNIVSYVPMDISGDYLFKIAEQLQQDFPSIKINPLQADYTQPINLPVTYSGARKVVFFPGSTIGNFKKRRIEQFMQVMSEMVGSTGALLIGVDLKKDPQVLEAAYNDSQGITAAFNKNILEHINSTVGSDFNTSFFEHLSIWNEDRSRIEMHLIATCDHEVSLNGSTIRIKKGESIHTENSHKYTLEDFKQLASNWFEVKKVWTDPKNYFSVQYLEPK